MTHLTFFDYTFALWQTIYTVLVASSVAIIMGIILACFLNHTRDLKGISIRSIRFCLNGIVNLGRSTPFIILLIALIPITRFIVGTSIGVNAALVPLTLAAIPFYTRIAQSALLDIPRSIQHYASSLGISSFRAYRFIYLPEIKQALIQGAALTIISLISYSAIAGAVGGGGIGQLAIDYGYQRFNSNVILITVAVLFALVQVIQWSANYLCKKPQCNKAIASFFIASLAACIVYNAPYALIRYQPGQHILKLGVMSGDTESIYKALQPLAAKKYGIHYKVVTFDDYATPNRALNDGDIDINIFQHKPFLDADITSHGYKIKPIIKTFTYPIGFYSKIIKSLNQLKDGDTIAIADDASNQGRELILLAKHHLIQLKPDVGLLANTHNIIANPHHYKIVTLDAAALPRSIHDAALVAINNAFLKDLHLRASQAILMEDRHSPYANIAVVRDQDAHDKKWRQWRAFLHSKEAIQITDHYYPDGEAVPAW